MVELEPWDISLGSLLDCCPSCLPSINDRARDPRALTQVVRKLARSGIFDKMPHAAVEQLSRRLRAIRMELLCGLYTPDCEDEPFELAVTWTTILWLVDDSLDKARSARELALAMRLHRRHTLPAFRGQVGRRAPALARFIAAHHDHFSRCANPETLSLLRRSANAWLLHGTFELARHTLSGQRLSLPEHAAMRRWDGAVDSCLAHLNLCFPELAPRIQRDPVLSELRAIAATHVALMNDILSYEQEVAHIRKRRGFFADANIVTTAAAHNDCSDEVAVVHVLKHLRALSQRFSTLRQRLVDSESSSRVAERLNVYVDCLGRMIQGNVLWSVESGRYRSPTAPLSFLRADSPADFGPLLKIETSPARREVASVFMSA